jgi:hypothetical protein
VLPFANASGLVATERTNHHSDDDGSSRHRQEPSVLARWIARTGEWSTFETAERSANT